MNRIITLYGFLMNILVISPRADEITDLHHYMQAHPEHRLFSYSQFESAFAELSQKSDFYTMVIIDEPDLDLLKQNVQNLRKLSERYMYLVAFFPDGFKPALLEYNINYGLYHTDLNEQLSPLFDAYLHLFDLIKIISNPDYDCASAGGVIARSAFNELFLSALDRAGRHQEDSYMLRLSIENYQSLYDLGGPYIADYAVAQLSRTMVSIRRQSDIIGQIQPNGFALLLQPGTATSPLQAAERFATTLSQSEDIVQDRAIGVTLSLELTALPSGEMMYERKISP